MIREIKTMIAVAQEGTFAAAGAKIGLTQAAVSAQMQRLEGELGFVIFERKGRTARLNSAGRQILAQARDLIRLYNNLGSASVDLASPVLVKIGSIASAQRSLLPDALAKFHRQSPKCRTHVVPGLSLDLINQVDAGELDLAITLRSPFSLQNDLRWTTLTREPFRLLVPGKTKGHDWSEILSTLPFIRYDRSSFGGRLVDRFLRNMHFPLHEVCEVDELEAIVKLVANGVGVALVPQTATYRRWPASVRAINLGEHTFYREVGLVHRTSRHLSEPVKQLADLIVAIFQSVPKK